MSYTNENPVANSLITLLEGAKLTVWSKNNLMYKEDIGDLFNTIEQSIVIIFIISNNSLKNAEFLEEVKFARKQNKIILSVVVEEINEDLKGGLIDLNEISVIDANSQQFNHVFSYITRIFGLNGDCQNEFPIKSFKFVNEKNFSENILSIVETKSKSDLMIVSTKTLYNFNIDELIIEEIFNTNDFEFTNSLCWIDHLQQYFAIISIENKHSIVAFNDTYEQVKSCSLPDIFQNGRLVMAYSKLNNKAYVFINERKLIQVFDENLKMEKLIALKFQYMVFNIFVHNDKFYTPDAHNYVIHVYDLDFNYFTSFGHSILGTGLTLHFDRMNNTNYLFAKANSCLYAFKIDNYNYVGQIPTDSMDNYSCFSNKKFIKVSRGSFSRDDGTFLKVYNIKYKIFKNKFIRNDGIQQVIDAKFVCKLNQLHQHLYQNTYLLPCENLACLECIYNHFNVFTNRFKCNFDSCQLEHRLTKKSIQPCNYIIDENIEEICQQLLKYEKELLIGDTIAKKFDHIESDLEIRIESLKNEIEEHGQSFIRSIDLIERRLIKQKKSKDNTRVYVHELRIISNEVVGKMIYLDE